jgi:hypothetical protein
MGIKGTLPRKRFELLEHYFHLNDTSLMPKQGEPNFDPLYIYRVRPVINSTCHTFQQVYTLGREINVNEGMITYRGRVSYLQYIPKKPTKFDIKVWMVAESKSGYVPNYIIYTGKLSEENCDPTIDNTNPPGIGNLLQIHDSSVLRSEF